MTEPRTFGREGRIVGDLSGLPHSASGPSNLIWWGNGGFMLIEGTGFALAAAAYLYLMTQAGSWPPAGDAPPGLLWSGIFTAMLLASEGLNLLLLKWARDKRETPLRWGSLAMLVVVALLLVARGFEFAHLNVPWYRDAYGSALWLLLVLHTTHLVTEWGENLVLTLWLFTHEVGDDQFADMEDNANYWTFVVAAWLPLYLLAYWAPRLGAGP